jgi:hypothetical protein
MRSMKMGRGGIHPHGNGKSPEASENTGVASLHCARRVRKPLKVKELNDLKEIQGAAWAASRRFIRAAKAAFRRG